MLTVYSRPFRTASAVGRQACRLDPGLTSGDASLIDGVYGRDRCWRQRSTARERYLVPSYEIANSRVIGANLLVVG